MTVKIKDIKGVVVEKKKEVPGLGDWKSIGFNEACSLYEEKEIAINRERLAKIGFDFLGTMERGYKLADAIIEHEAEILEGK